MVISFQRSGHILGRFKSQMGKSSERFAVLQKQLHALDRDSSKNNANELSSSKDSGCWLF